MLRTQEWVPDHCGCIIDLAYDDQVGTMVAIEHVRKCQYHRNTSLANLYSTVSEESSRIQTIRERILIALPGLSQTILQLDGSSYTDFKLDRQPKFEFDTNRVLTITIPNISPVQRVALQATADNRVGPGKVIIG